MTPSLLRWLAALAALAGLAACTADGPTSPDGPRNANGTPVTVPDGGVSGEVAYQNGRSAGGLRVSLTQLPSGIEQTGNLAAIALSGGLVCLDRRPGAPCGPANAPSTTTNGDGRYRVALGPSPAGGTSTDNYVLAVGSPEQSGPAIAAEFRLELPEHRAPTLTFWEPEVTQTIDAKSASLEFSTLERAEHDEGLGYTLTYLDAQGGIVWHVDRAVSGERLDTRVLEDSIGEVVVGARARMTIDEVGYSMRFSAAGAPYRSPAGVPLSRGRPCTMLVDERHPAMTCPHTDGDFGSVGAPASRQTVVELGASVPVGLVVVRGCVRCAVATSVDGVTYAPYGTTGQFGADSAMASTRPTTARFVRVTDRSGAPALREISVWERGEDDSLREVPGQSGVRPRATIDRGEFPLVGWLAATIALVAAGGAGYALARRRRTI